MKLLGLYVFLVVVIQLSYLELRVDALPSGRFVETKGVQFNLNGYPYYANGFNAYRLMYVASDPSQRPKISSAFQEASRHGLTVARTWAFCDAGYRPLQFSPGSYNEDMFQGLDFAIAEARRHGIKMILSFANNYVSFGEKKYRTCEIGYGNPYYKTELTRMQDSISFLNSINLPQCDGY